MHRAPVLAVVIALPVAALIGGSADAAGPMPTPSSTSTAATGSMAATARPGKLPVIHGAVGPGYDISVDPRKTTAGRYKFVVEDPNGAHNWHIFGPGGVDKATSVPGVGKSVWRINLVPGTYTIQCDEHAPVMHTKLKVT